MGEYDSQPLVRMQMFVDAMEERTVKQQQRVASRPVVVYYMQVGELIKIGYTGHLRQRMAAYPPNSRLLATEPGNHVLEQRRHQQLAELLSHGNEWFRPGVGALPSGAVRCVTRQPTTVVTRASGGSPGRTK